MLHIMPFNTSMINFSNETYNPEGKTISQPYLQAVVDFHKEEPSFAARPLLTKSIDFMSETFSIKPGTSFIVINMFLFLFVGFMISVIGKSMELTKKEVNFSLLLYFSSFTVLFAFFPPIYTYEDFLQYAFLFVFYYAIIKKRWLLMFTSFTLALITRESSILLLPGIGLVLMKNRLFSIKFWPFFITMTISVVLFVVFYFSYIKQLNISSAAKNQFLNRFEPLYLNFQSFQFAIETITCFLLVFLVPLILIKKVGIDHLSENQQKLIRIFFITLLINTLITVCSTKAREARIYALPLVFIWPFLGVFLTKLKVPFKKLNRVEIVVIGLLVILSILYALATYLPTEGGNSQNLFNEYFFVLLLSIIFIQFFTVKKNQIDL